MVESAVDFGCGVGTWLSVLKEKGAKDIQGYDGNWVDQNLLVIDKLNFTSADLSKKITINKKYDLAISLEVAEHLPASFADEFVATLTSASDFVLFSAAIPEQSGNFHINEQWPDYWAKIFLKYDFLAFDFIRNKIWNDKEIPFWYKQNILFFAKKQRAQDVKEEITVNISSLVHPDLFLKKSAALKVGIKGSLKLFFRAIKNYLTSK